MSSQETIEADSSPDIAKNTVFEPKTQPKIIRVLTVFAYVLSVSMAAILLSIYYVFMWEGRPHIGALRQPEGLQQEFTTNYSDFNGKLEEYSTEQNYSISFESTTFNWSQEDSTTPSIFLRKLL